MRSQNLAKTLPTKISQNLAKTLTTKKHQENTIKYDGNLFRNTYNNYINHIKYFAI